ncbi:hypothetical protein BS47DRAFT_1389387 [Hydnum rufescens UP504]|uniref:Transcription elongation factor S-II n=1 Tax=Hydnum rufescens UP504 TaxID=1448309 RepID=A0A9P6B5I6_9AGAM|nr:hypothetical protein BS47DRAFT_1389387 [Hydnum rufescens UP504]
MADVAEVKGLVKALNAAAAGQGTTQDLLAILRRLQKEVAATEQLLKDTKVGVAVSKLRNHTAKEVSDLSKAIVKKWKSEVHTGDKPKTKSPTTAAGPNKFGASTKLDKSEPASNSASPAPTPRGSEVPTTPVDTRPPQTLSNNKAEGRQRTTKTDGISASVLGDKVRDKCLEMVYDALACDSGSPYVFVDSSSEQILSKARAVENNVYLEFRDINASYRNKMRRLYLNLKDKHNPRLRESVVSGDLQVARFCNMTEMASEERRQADKQLEELNFHNSLGAGEQEAETDAFQCGRCKERKTRYRQAQTRSADEPMTTFVTLLRELWQSLEILIALTGAFFLSLLLLFSHYLSLLLFEIPPRSTSFQVT